MRRRRRARCHSRRSTPAAAGLTGGLVQSLLQPGIDLPDETVPVDDVEGGDDADVHGRDDHRGHGGHTRPRGPHTVPATSASLHAGTTR